jgi:hypothetical protein
MNETYCMQRAKGTIRSLTLAVPCREHLKRPAAEKHFYAFLYGFHARE